MKVLSGLLLVLLAETAMAETYTTICRTSREGFTMCTTAPARTDNSPCAKLADVGDCRQIGKRRGKCNPEAYARIKPECDAWLDYYNIEPAAGYDAPLTD